uniref:putative E3 ubiquitin-protein ligase LIN-2 n=1 Tax=Erigeron canadensis TaxID=72917 RepID=UPI001CB915EE|nr:putative E3 ubiquitin-protein ligase LIN-2 [Erigeron canadensis]
MSLEDLLADEGFKTFKGRKSRTISRASTGIVSKRIPVYPPRDEHKQGSSVRLRKTERAYSDVNRYDMSVKSPLTDLVKGRRSLDVFKREKLVKRSTNGTNGKHIRSRSQEIHVDIETSTELSKPSSVGELALDELAIKAIIHMLNVHTKRFIKDRDFRTSLHHSCLDLLISTDLNDEVKVITNLEQAIESVERATEDQADPKSLKKAALQLSVITGLNKNELKDGFTSGISNSVLSNCGHLYLSVIYCLQNKERVAARHLLQVFIDSPFSARTTLVPELWDNIFHPHLVHLDDWYNQEIDFLLDDASNPRKLKKLKKLYDEVLDTGTHKLALYYKDWLTDGMEAPLIPTIDVPSVSFRGVQRGGSLVHGSLDFSTPANAFTPEHMVTKNLNDSGIKHASVAGDVEVHQTMQMSDDGSLVENKMTVIHSLEEREYKDLHIKQYGEVHHEALGARETMELLTENVLGKYRNGILQQECRNVTNILQTLSVSEVNELSLKMLQKSVFQQNERSTCLPHLDNAHPQIETRPISGERERYFFDIPQDYICPLTGLIFKDPVTLETGQTYERVAIAEWFSEGNKSCPVTNEILEYHKIPRTNFILCRVIDKWKAEYSRNILALACQLEGSPREQKSKDEEAIFILEKLFTLFGEGEDKRIGKQLIAFGGLQFLIKKFEYGDMDEKTCVAALLLCCIKADSGCRINMTRSIEKTCLLELLHCKETKSIANAVLLLFELICLNRRKDVHFFLNGLQKESIMSSMHILLVFLRDCPPEQKPLIAVLLLHLDLMIDQQKYSIYREQAADFITSAMNTSFVDDTVRVTCCRALLILGGRISFSGKVMTEDWILKKAGFLDGPELEAQEDEVTVKDYILKESEEEDVAVNDWLMKMSAFLLSDRKTSFLHLLSRCLKSGHRDMTRVSLTTMTWLSSTLAFLPYYKSRVSVFSVVINQLKENLKDGESVEHRILATMSLLNFSKIPECKELLMTIADEIIVPLRDLCEATWMAKELSALICQKNIDSIRGHK